MTGWSASQYLKFERERTQPSRDPANLIALNRPGELSTSKGRFDHLPLPASVFSSGEHPDEIIRKKNHFKTGSWNKRKLMNQTAGNFTAIQAGRRCISGHEHFAPPHENEAL